VFEKLVLAFAGRAASSKRTKASVPLSGMAVTGGVTVNLEDPPIKDAETPEQTITLVERCRLHVAPLNGRGGRVPCGPFSWKWEEPLGKLEVSPNTASAWFYPVACGICVVTVSGAKREAVIRINIIAAVPETLNLVADAPEVFRDLSVLDATAAIVL
jgi:hypothetical protein